MNVPVQICMTVMHWLLALMCSVVSNAHALMAIEIHGLIIDIEQDDSVISVRRSIAITAANANIHKGNKFACKNLLLVHYTCLSHVLILSLY